VLADPPDSFSHSSQKGLLESWKDVMASMMLLQTTDLSDKVKVLEMQKVMCFQFKLLETKSLEQAKGTAWATIEEVIYRVCHVVRSLLYIYAREC